MTAVFGAEPHCVAIPVLNIVCGSVSSALDGVVSVLFAGILSAVTNTAVFALHGVGSAMGTATAVNLQAPWFTGNYRAMVAISTTFALGALVLASADSAIRRDPSIVLRAAFVHLPIAGLTVLVVMKVTSVAMKGVDELIATLERTSGTPALNLVKSLSHLYVELSGTAPGLFTVVIGLIVTLGTLAVWFELLLRSAAIAAVVLLFPLVMAAQVWPSLGRQAKRVTEVLFALIVSKLVVAAVLLLGASAITNHAGVAGVLLGSTLVLLAAFAPFLVLRLIPMAEAVLATGLEGQRQRAFRVVTTTARVATKAGGALAAGRAAPLEQLVARATRNASASTSPLQQKGPKPPGDLGGLVGVAPPPPRPPIPPVPGAGLPKIDHILVRDDYGPMIKAVTRQEP